MKSIKRALSNKTIVAVNNEITTRSRAAFVRGERSGFRAGILIGMALQGVLMLIGYGIGHALGVVP